MTARRSRWQAASGLGALGVAAAAALVTVPHDPGSVARCGSLLGGGLTGSSFECEQTRGVYRAVVALGLLLGLALIGSVLVRARWAEIVAALVVVCGTGASLLLAGQTALGDPLTYRWIASLPMALAGACTPGLVALVRRRGA